MINHARTILLNKRAEEVAGGEYVDPSFSPVYLTGPLHDMHQLLFPGNLSAEKRLESMRIYDGFLWLPEYRKYLTAMDDRLSYEPDVSDVSGSSSTTREFLRLFPNVAAIVLGGRKVFFKKTGKWGARREELSKVWLGAVSDVDKFTAALYSFVFAVEEMRNV